MIHLIGYGNPARGDDGLGPAFAEAVSRRGYPGLAVAIDYQLTVDHALWIAEAERVVFVDAMMQDAEPFRFAAVQPSNGAGVASHSLTPSTVLALAEALYGRAPPAHVLAISGVHFGDVTEGLSSQAAANLERALGFYESWIAPLTKGRTEEVIT